MGDMGDTFDTIDDVTGGRARQARSVLLALLFLALGAALQRVCAMPDAQPSPDMAPFIQWQGPRD